MKSDFNESDFVVHISFFKVLYPWEYKPKTFI